MKTATQFDVIIIGAGISGLVAARKLTRAGRRICIVEARSRVGGRIQTITHPMCPAPIEIGAEFIHQPAPLLLELLAEYNLPYQELSGENLTKAGSGLTESTGWETIGKTMRRAASLKEDLSFTQFLKAEAANLTADEEAEVLGFVEGFNAAPASDISALALGREYLQGGEDTYQSFRLTKGYSALPEAVAAELETVGADLRLQASVSAVRWQAGEVEVSAQQGGQNLLLTSAKLICSVPASLLASRQIIGFSPEIPEKRAAAGQIGNGIVIKILLLFEDAWWRELKSADGKPLSNFSFVTAPNQPVPVWWNTSPIDSPLLVGWLGGPKALELSPMGEDQLCNSAIASLAAIFGISPDAIKAQLRFCSIKNWQADPLSRGSYCYLRAGHLEAQKQLAQPISATLFFAGDSSQTEGLSGTVESAIKSGLRAAAEVLETV